jgi:hypothetical protein
MDRRSFETASLPHFAGHQEVAMKTASFYSYNGPGLVSIARFGPRNAPARYRSYKPLAPGPWFQTVPEDAYGNLYGAQLALLDAATVVKDLESLAGIHEPILVCYEGMAECDAGRAFCHRHQAARWLEQELGIEVPELRGHFHEDPAHDKPRKSSLRSLGGARKAISIIAPTMDLRLLAEARLEATKHRYASAIDAVLAGLPHGQSLIDSALKEIDVVRYALRNLPL